MSFQPLGLCLAGSIALLCATSAQAAELDAQSPDVYDWSGLFVGSDTGFGFGGDAATTEAEGFVNGGEATANWQTGKWVLGVDGDVRFADISDTETNGVSGLAYSSEADAPWFTTMRLRSGYAL